MGIDKGISEIQVIETKELRWHVEFLGKFEWNRKLIGERRKGKEIKWFLDNRDVEWNLY